jgi:hypothetical protein
VIGVEKFILYFNGVFVGKYREFHKLYSKGDYHAAAQLLLALLQARLAPKP